MEKTILNTVNAPEAIGPYSQGIEVGGWIFTSGQLPIDPETGIMEEKIEAQAMQSLKNVAAVLEAAGSSVKDAVKMTVFLFEM